MRIIFLDFDGVISNIGNRSRNAFSRSENQLVMYGVNIDQIFNRPCVERLARFTIATQAKIVFSTSWRNSFSTEELSRILRAIAPFPATCFAGTTPYFEGKRRGLEIDNWLKTLVTDHSQVEYVILDDAPECEFLPDQMARFVQTNHMCGLQSDEVEKARLILKCQS
jgi:hypothetical protein